MMPMSDEEIKQTPDLNGRMLRAIALGSEGYIVRFEGGVRDPLVRRFIDLRSFSFFGGKAIAKRIVRDWNHHEELIECLQNTVRALETYMYKAQILPLESKDNRLDNARALLAKIGGE